MIYRFSGSAERVLAYRKIALLIDRRRDYFSLTGKVMGAGAIRTRSTLGSTPREASSAK